VIDAQGRRLDRAGRRSSRLPASRSRRSLRAATTTPVSAGTTSSPIRPTPASSSSRCRPSCTACCSSTRISRRAHKVAGQSATLDLAVERAAGRYTAARLASFWRRVVHLQRSDARRSSGPSTSCFFTQHELNPVARPRSPISRCSPGRASSSRSRSKLRLGRPNRQPLQR